jgi:hypothetical protein
VQNINSLFSQHSKKSDRRSNMGRPLERDGNGFDILGQIRTQELYQLRRRSEHRLKMGAI